MRNRVIVKSKLVRPSTADGTSSPTGAFDTSARLDVQAALIRNQTLNTAAWKTWDNQHAGAPEPFPVFEAEKGESIGMDSSDLEAAA